MQYLAASKQLMMFLQLVSTQLDSKQGLKEDVNYRDFGGGTSFRSQRGASDKRGESIKIAKSHHYQRKNNKQGI